MSVSKKYVNNGRIQILVGKSYQEIGVFVTEDPTLAIHEDLERPYLFTVTQISSGLAVYSCGEWERAMQFVWKARCVCWSRKYLDETDLKELAEVIYMMDTSAEQRRARGGVKDIRRVVKESISRIKSVYRDNKELIDGIQNKV